MKYSDKDLESLIDEVSTDFETHLKKNEQSDVIEDTKIDEIKVEAKTEDGQENQNLAKSEDNVETSNEDLDYDDEDVAEMNELYGSMTKAEAKAHYQAVKSVLFTEKEDETSTEPVVMTKSEDAGQDGSIDDSDLEAQLAASKQETEDLKKSVGDLVTMLHKNVTTDQAPQQKAITEIQYMAKSEDDVKIEDKENSDVDFETMTKNEAGVLLRTKIRGNDLTKSDRERINAFYLDSETNIDSIKDLIGG